MLAYNDKIPCMTSTHMGDKWVGELLTGHPMRFHIAFRMSPQIFTDLLYLLQTSYGLQGSQRITAREVLAITIYSVEIENSVSWISPLGKGWSCTYFSPASKMTKRKGD
ncbi:hypothetical protein KSP40_PGU020649 [Platanthera guangdongensis]|uniref:DUF8040 domain-containing protein n=1 Tax=Platanthera guangdongensis TaxID=2320717 RepID=A0ABR2M951_9ASPA